MVTVRRVGPDDWQLWRDARLRALADAPYAFGSTYAREVVFEEGDWLARINCSALFLALDGTRAVGIIGGFRSSDDEHEIVSMWVDVGARGTGVATQLVESIKAWATAEGAKRLRLWVADGNERARRFYERIGFRSTGKRMPLPSDPNVEEEQMAIDLEGASIGVRLRRPESGPTQGIETRGSS